MRISLNKLTLTALLCLGFAACMDHSGQLTLPAHQPAPVGDPDQKIIDPLLGGANGGGGSNTGGGNTGGGNNNGGGGNNGGGSGGTGGGPAGGPVPEPGTMLLVGTGLAGAAMLRRKRKAAH